MTSRFRVEIELMLQVFSGCRPQDTARRRIEGLNRL
jgi:hypothetical protein